MAEIYEVSAALNWVTHPNIITVYASVAGDPTL
jgi:hypothetical protein